MLRPRVAAPPAAFGAAAAVVFLALLLVALAGPLPVSAQQVGTRSVDAPPPLRKGTGLPLPRFASLRSDETNVRAGPGSRYPIEWVFKRKSMPVEIVAEYENYRKIRDWQGSGGWVHQSLLTGKRSVTITKEAILYKTPATSATQVARLQTEVICLVKSCNGDWCRVQTGPYVGWIERAKVWGVYKGEVVN